MLKTRVLNKAQISYNMSRVRSKGSKLEKFFAAGLRKRRIKYRSHAKRVLGCPDFVIVNQKIAVFCDSHFWHGYDWKNKKQEHKSNIGFWIKKIEANIARDKKVTHTLRGKGWKVLRFWEHEILSSPNKCLNKIEKFLSIESS